MTCKTKKKYRELQKITKGISNHRRIQILDLLFEKPNLSIFEISDELNVNFKTISAHASRLAVSELVRKRQEGSSVLHELTRRGEIIRMFLRTFE